MSAPDKDRRQVLGKIAHVAGEGNVSLGVQRGGDARPASDDGFPGLSQTGVRPGIKTFA
jgi:hypothetical protein